MYFIIILISINGLFCYTIACRISHSMDLITITPLSVFLSLGSSFLLILVNTNTNIFHLFFHHGGQQQLYIIQRNWLSFYNHLNGFWYNRVWNTSLSGSNNTSIILIAFLWIHHLFIFINNSNISFIFPSHSQQQLL